MDNQKQPKLKKSLLKKGLIVFILGFIVNTALMLIGVGGIVRELARLAVIVGIVMIIFGMVKKIFKKI